MPPPSVCVLGDWDGEGLASIFGFKNYDWFPMIREMQVKVTKTRQFDYIHSPPLLV